MFGKTLGLLQLSSQTRRMNNRRTKAAAVLRKTADCRDNELLRRPELCAASGRRRPRG